MEAPLKFLVAPGPFKECLSAKEVADRIEEGLKKIEPDVVVQKLPMSDGGIGLVDRIVEHSNGNIKYCKVRDPLGKIIRSHYGIISKNKKRIGIIESASAAGLALVPIEMRDPRFTSTFGVGELMKRCLDDGCSELIIGCGDSATNNGGFGMAKALGIKFLDAKNRELPDGGIHLINLKKIDLSGLDKRIQKTIITVACNLSSVLCGPEGTSYIYAPQKGADPKMVKNLAKALDNYAKVVYETTGKDIRYIPGGGGSGGLAAGLYAFMNARLRFSFHIINNFLNLERYLRDKDIVITGEGRIDANTASGKVVYAVALTAKKFGLPVIAIVGSIADNARILYYSGIDLIEPICNEPTSLKQSILKAEEWISKAAMRIMRMIKLTHNIKLNKK